MKIRWKMLIVISLALIIFMGTMHVVVTSILSSSYGSLEQESCEVQISQTMNAFAAEENGLLSTITDYTNWDDTYDFIEHGDPNYLAKNMVPETYANLGLSDVAIVDVGGGVLYSEHYDEGFGLGPGLGSLIDHVSFDGMIFKEMQRSV
ncbi:MAG TPA: CHASE4 domain-containing protein, partial [Methanomassiliicoccales archaeon]|nr:CHASE4 domain-containing protein [Methanomassiliicoccales archaeon]